MRVFAVFALVALAAVAVSAQSSTGGAGPGNGPQICDRIVQAYGRDYTNAAAAVDAMRLFIADAGTNAKGDGKGFMNDPSIKKYFDGSVNYRQNGPVASPFPGASPNYVAGGAPLNTLLDHFAQFLGQPSALACSASGYPAYQSTVAPFGAFTQYQVHANMNITGTIFTAFNTYVADTATTKGLSADDVTTISAVLGNFGRSGTAPEQNDICWMQGCPCATNLVGDNCDAPQGGPASTVQVSFITMAVAALLAVFAMRR
jgi:hypothetical protein